MAIPTDIEGTWFNTTVSLDAGELRRADGAMFAGDGTTTTGASGGIVRHGDSSLSVSVDGSDVVTVQPGAVVVPGNAVSNTGAYRLSLSAAITGSLAARNATNPRITLVIFRAYDDDVVGTHNAYKGTIEFVNGTPGAVPAVPTLPSMAVELARITVPNTGGGAASVDLTHRTYAAALGAEIAVPTSSMLPASAAKYQTARALDTGSRYEYNGGWTSVADECHVQRAAAFSVPTGAATAVSFDTEVRDTSGMFAPTSTNVTITTAGRYRITGRASLSTTTAGVFLVTIAKGGTDVAALFRGSSSASSSSPQFVSGVCELDLAVSDVITLRIFQNTGGAVNTTTGIYAAEMIVARIIA